MQKLRGAITFDDPSNTYRVQVLWDLGHGRVIDGLPEGGTQDVLQAHAEAARGVGATWDGSDVDAVHGTVARPWPSTPSDPPYVDPPTGGP